MGDFAQVLGPESDVDDATECGVLGAFDRVGRTGDPPFKEGQRTELPPECTIGVDAKQVTMLTVCTIWANMANMRTANNLLHCKECKVGGDTDYQ